MLPFRRFNPLWLKGYDFAKDPNFFLFCSSFWTLTTMVSHATPGRGATELWRFRNDFAWSSLFMVEFYSFKCLSPQDKSDATFCLDWIWGFEVILLFVVLKPGLSQNVGRHDIRFGLYSWEVFRSHQNAGCPEQGYKLAIFARFMMVIVSNVAVDRQNSVASLFDCLLEKLRLCFLNQSRNFYINVSLGFFISTYRKKLGYVGIDHGLGLDDGCPWQGRKSGGDDLLSGSRPELEFVSRYRWSVCVSGYPDWTGNWYWNLLSF